jgi:DNA-binding beta-propeller fold protein YncE
LRIGLLLFLAGTASALLIFSGWYLLFRKPISEFPLPIPTAERMPAFSYSLYGVQRPMGVAVNADGSRIYATQSEGDAAVVAYDGLGTQLAIMLPPETGTDHVFVYVAIDPLSGDVYVTDRPMAAIHVYTAEGAYRRTIEHPSTLDGWQPLGVSFTSLGHMVVTDAGRNQVHEFATDGSLLRSIGAPGQFNFPNAAIVDGTGMMYISDSNNGRVVVLDEIGSQIAVLRRGPYEGDLGMPRGLAVDDAGRIYVVDNTDQSVKVYRPAAAGEGAPTFVGRFGENGIADGAFRFPNAVATDARGRVYVADWSNDRIQVWTY